MNTTSTSTQRTATAVSTPVYEDVRLASPLSWGSIFAGCFAGLGLHLVLTILGMGIGLGSINPLTDPNPAADFSIGAGIAWSVSALIALWTGGYIAGRSIPQGDKQSGLIHGFVVWGVATVAMIFMLTSSASMAVSGAAKAVGKGVSATAQAVGSATPDNANPLSAITGQNAEMIAPFMDELSAGSGQLAQRNLSPTAKREIAISLARFLGSNTPANRDGLITTLSERAGIPRADAERMVGDWQASYSRVQTNLREMRNEAEQTARQAADKAASAVSRASIWTFVAFAIGAIAAAFGGRSGASSAARRTSDAEVVR